MSALKNRGGVGMVLLDAKILAGVPEYGCELGRDPIAYVKLFTVTGWAWYVLSVDRKQLVAYCYVTALGDLPNEGEEGTIDLNELANLTFFGGALGVERSLGWKPAKLSAIKKGGAS